MNLYLNATNMYIILYVLKKSSNFILFAFIEFSSSA